MTTDSQRVGRAIWALIALGILVNALTLGVALNWANGERSRVDSVNAYIYCSLERAKTTLPTLSYYMRHPRELEQALDVIVDQQREFVPPSEPCAP